MELPKLSNAPVSLKLLATSLLCSIGLTYIALLLHIYIDTEMRPSLVANAYKSMEYVELTNGAHDYLPYYIFFLFAPSVSLFMLTSYSESIKRFFAVFPFLVIAADIGSMYMIHYVSPHFAYALWIAGTLLALTFLTIFLLTMYDIWLRKATELK